MPELSLLPELGPKTSSAADELTWEAKRGRTGRWNDFGYLRQQRHLIRQIRGGWDGGVSVEGSALGCYVDVSLGDNRWRRVFQGASLPPLGATVTESE
eukprot:5435156-Pyramimonas_sp.AAC.1